jgi:hypothetical protein
MIWHPRVNTDAAHAWLRGEIRRIGKDDAFVTFGGYVHCAIVASKVASIGEY